MKEAPAPLSVRSLYASLAQLLLGYVFASSGLCKLTGGAFGQVIGPPTADMVPGLASIWPRTYAVVRQGRYLRAVPKGLPFGRSTF